MRHRERRKEGGMVALPTELRSIFHFLNNIAVSYLLFCAPKATVRINAVFNTPLRRSRIAYLPRVAGVEEEGAAIASELINHH